MRLSVLKIINLMPVESVRLRRKSYIFHLLADSRIAEVGAALSGEVDPPIQPYYHFGLRLSLHSVAKKHLLRKASPPCCLQGKYDQLSVGPNFFSLFGIFFVFLHSQIIDDYAG